MKKRYEDMTPQEQQEYRFSDPRGTVVNGVRIPDPPDDDDEPTEKPASALDAVADKISAIKDADRQRARQAEREAHLAKRR